MGPPMVRLRCRTLFSTHLFHLRERKALLVAYPSTSATLSVGKWAAQWPQADTTYDRARRSLSSPARDALLHVRPYPTVTVRSWAAHVYPTVIHGVRCECDTSVQMRDEPALAQRKAKRIHKVHAQRPRPWSLTANSACNRIRTPHASGFRLRRFRPKNRWGSSRLLHRFLPSSSHRWRGP